MKSQFPWYPFPDSKSDPDQLWESALFTFDANVLLDLYRYNASTRNEILSSIEDVKSKAWITYQAAEEFFRNRTKVICSNRKSFREADSALASFSSSLSDTIQKLNNARLIEEDEVKSFNSKVLDAISSLKRSNGVLESEFPNFLEKDVVLEKLLEIFDSRIGLAPDDAGLAAMNAEAAKRIKNKIPPGYMDADKDSDRPYGDYLLWAQIIEKVKAEKKPLILVTSERKEDWWERHSGLTIGPRQELIRELYEESGQGLHLYQTRNFVEQSLNRRAKNVNAKQKEAIYDLLQKAIKDIQALELNISRHTLVEAVSQQEIFSSESSQSGTLSVKIRRPTKNFTATGHFSPNFSSIPITECELIESPDRTPPHKISVGSGTTFDFNVHLSTTDGLQPLPPGLYKFTYKSELQPS